MAFIYILVENYWEVWSNIDLDQDMNEEAQFDEKQERRRRGNQPGASTPKNAFGARR